MGGDSPRESQLAQTDAAAFSGPGVECFRGPEELEGYMSRIHLSSLSEELAPDGVPAGGRTISHDEPADSYSMICMSRSNAAGSVPPAYAAPSGQSSGGAFL